MRLRKRMAGLGLLLVVIFSLTFSKLTLADTSFQSAGSPVTTRLAGYDSYETASQIAKAGWGQSEYAILAYGENYPDALASVPLAHKYDAPILLTTSDNLPATTKQIVRDLEVKNVIIIGGPGVIQSSVDTELETMGVNVSRVFGYDQYETAVEVARQLDDPEEFFVVTGDDFPDALSVASIAGIQQMPILLVPQDFVPRSVINYISGRQMCKVYVVGDSDVISDYVFDHFPNGVRCSGSDKYARNLNVIQEFADVFNTDAICLATGERFTDALAGAAYAAKLEAPTLLINDNPSTVTAVYAKSQADKVGNFCIFGGTGIIPEYVIWNLTSDNDFYAVEEEEPQQEVTTFASEVLRLTNLERAKEGLSPLSGSNVILRQAADKRAAEAIDNWSHTRPNGEECFTVFKEFGITEYRMVGENLYYGSIGTPEDAVNSWMNSPGHRANILRPNFTHLGVGVAVDDRGVTYSAQLFMQE